MRRRPYDGTKSWRLHGRAARNETKSLVTTARAYSSQGTKQWRSRIATNERTPFYKSCFANLTPPTESQFDIIYVFR